MTGTKLYPYEAVYYHRGARPGYEVVVAFDSESFFTAEATALMRCPAGMVMWSVYFADSPDSNACTWEEFPARVKVLLKEMS